MRTESRTVQRSWVKHRKKRNYAVLGTVTALLIVVIVAISAIPAPAVVRVGQLAPDFTLPDINNVNFHLYDHRGRPVLIEFMTTSCPACTQQAPILSELWSQHGVHADFVSISIDPARDQPAILSAYAEQHDMNWTWAIDQRQVMQTYGVTATPTIFLLDKDSIVKHHFVGLQNLQTLESSLSALL
jgi:cytochrome oxidase Cu insertion factor (SCO1/SenC/PrrC family)